MTGIASLVLGAPKHHTAISRHGKTLAKLGLGIYFQRFSSSELLEIQNSVGMVRLCRPVFLFSHCFLNHSTDSLDFSPLTPSHFVTES